LILFNDKHKVINYNDIILKLAGENKLLDEEFKELKDNIYYLFEMFFKK